MTLNINTRIFNFNGKDMRLGKKYIRYVWFYKDNIRVSDNISLLIVPCENEFLKDFCLGIKYKALKNEFANKSENGSIKLRIEFQDDDLLSAGLKVNKEAILRFGDFHTFKTKIAIGSDFLRHKLEEKTFKHQNEIKPQIFDEIAKNAESPLIKLGSGENEFVALRRGIFLNGLDKNKGFRFIYDNYGYGQTYKMIQDDLILFECGTRYEW